MPKQTEVDLVNIFQAVTQSLVENQKNLNKADTYNKDHGNNMVQTFQTITDALEKKKGDSDSAALAYAAKALSKNAASGSAKLYAENLSRAAGQFKGKSIDGEGALQLLQVLIGGSQVDQTISDQATDGGDILSALMGGIAAGGPAAQESSSPGGDLLGALLGGMTAEESTPQGSSSDEGGDLLGALMGGMAGTESSNAGTQSGLGLSSLLSAGMAFLQAKQSGEDNLQALVQAFAAGSGMGESSHRTQSTQVVVQSFLQALNSMSKQ
jgi:hypothetical protein